MDIWKILEIIGAIIGWVSTIFFILAMAHIFLVGSIKMSIALALNLHAGIYANAAIDVYYVIADLMIWRHWTKKRTYPQRPLHFSYSTPSEILMYFCLLIPTFFLLYTLLLYTDSNVVFLDAIVTSMSMAGAFMWYRKKVDAWVVSIVGDIFAIVLYLHKDMDYYAMQFMGKGVLYVIGWIVWHRKYKKGLADLAYKKAYREAEV